MLRVLALTPDFPPAVGGIQTLMHRLIVHFRKLDVRVVARRTPGWDRFDRAAGIDVRRAGDAGGGPASNLLLNGRGLAEAARFRPQSVISGHIVTSPAARAAGRALRVPVVQYLHADELRTRARLASFAMGADAVVAVSSHTRELALSAGADPARLHVIPNGVDLPEARVNRSEAGVGGPAGRPTVITVGRLERRYKGHDVMLEAMPRVRQRVRDVQWLIVGDGSLRPELERRAAELGLGDTVSFLGRVSDAERDALLDRAHVFAMPSRLPAGGVGGEGFGIVYLEAAARGLPVVAGAVGGALDAVVDGETGLLVDPTEASAIAAAIGDLLSDRERAVALGEAGALRARDFSWPRIAGELEELLLALDAGRGERGRGPA